MDNTNAKALLRRFNALRGRRDGYWRNLWREARRYCHPDMDCELTEGSLANNARLFDTTAIQARDRLASGMYTWMAPGDRKWFRLAPLPASHGGRPSSVEASWFSGATDALTEALNRSNYHGELLKALNDLACGLDAVMYCEESADGTPTFRCFPIEDCCYCLDADDRLDTVFREIRMTARNVVDHFARWKEAQVPQEIQDEAGDQSRCDACHTILHVVIPRKEQKPDAVGVEHMKYESVFLDERTGSVILSGGYEEMPYAVCRFRKNGREPYGRGPGIDLLPDIRMLNAMREAFIRNCEFSADPAWMIPEDSLVSRNFDRSPGALVFFRPSLNGQSPTPVNRQNNPQLDQAVIDGERQRIRDGFYWDVFDPLGDIRNMTAQEATIRNESKLVPFGPIACNIHNDLFRPMLERAFAILLRSGGVEPPPQEVVENGAYRVDFQSRIALAVKRQSALGWLQTESTLQGMTQVSPEVIDNFDFDRITRDIAESNGCDATWLRASSDVEKIRADRQQAQQEAQEQQMALQVAGSAGQLGKKPETGSPMEGVMGALVGGANQ